MNIALKLLFKCINIYFILLLFLPVSRRASSTAARGELQPTIVANRRGWLAGFVLRANWRVLGVQAWRMIHCTQRPANPNGQSHKYAYAEKKTTK